MSDKTKDLLRPDDSAHRSRHLDRRTVVKGLAWSVPAIAVATAAPAQALSGCTGTPIVKRVTGSGPSKGQMTFTIPANAKCITYVIEGAGGQGAGSTARNGGSGARIEGSLTSCGSDREVTLVAGGGGTGQVGGDGYGRGGAPLPRQYPSGNIWYAVHWGGGGGGGSAILIGSQPVVVAGGGGGAGSDGWLAQSTSASTYPNWTFGGAGKNANGGVAPGGRGDDSRLTHSSWFLEGDGGLGATGTAPGTGDGATWNLPAVDAGPYESVGESGTGPGATGGNGGDAVSASYQRTWNGSSWYVYAASGGGGGGYAGGGAGGAGAASFRQPWSGGEAMSIFAAAGAGGAGSNFVGSASGAGCTTTATATSQGTAGNGGFNGGGGVGSVTVSYYL